MNIDTPLVLVTSLQVTGCCSAASCRPFGCKFSAARKGFLGSDAGGRQGGVQTCARHGILLRETFGEKDREAADERITRARGIHRGYGKRRHVDVSGRVGKQSTAGAEREHHPAETFVAQRGGTCRRL